MSFAMKFACLDMIGNPHQISVGKPERKKGTLKDRGVNGRTAFHRLQGSGLGFEMD
jgi:hypothetical protein